jgi:hypothetical protein
MATARAIFQAHVDGLTPESLPFDLQWSLPIAYSAVQRLDLNVGNNLITPPTNATVVAIQPPANSTAVLKLKGAVGDTGVTLHPTLPSVISITAATPIYLNASIGTAGFLIFMA